MGLFFGCAITDSTRELKEFLTVGIGNSGWLVMWIVLPKWYVVV